MIRFLLASVLRHLATIAILGLTAAPVGAQTSDAWTAEKCRLYGDAWEAAKGMQGTAGLGDAFLARHDAFLASNCTRAHDVCPVSPQERQMADLLTVMSMSEGMASTFVPFACPGR